MPRRIYTYLPGLGWEMYNSIATVGAAVTAAGVAVFVANAILTQRRLPDENPNRWAAGTLEWATPNPVPNYNFETIPMVRSRYPLWDQESVTLGDPQIERWTVPLRVPRHRRREILTTTEIDAEPQSIMSLPQQSYWPVLSASSIALALAGLLADVYWLMGVGMVASLYFVVAWTWPNRDFDPIPAMFEDADARPVGVDGRDHG